MLLTSTLKHFEECFSCFHLGSAPDKVFRYRRRDSDGLQPGYISGQVSITGSEYRYGYGIPAPWLIDFIEHKMIVVGYDSIYFSIVQQMGRDNKYLQQYRLYAKYNLVLGDLYICDVVADSVPTK